MKIAHSLYAKAFALDAYEKLHICTRNSPGLEDTGAAFFWDFARVFAIDL